MALSPPPFAIWAACLRRSSTRPPMASALARKAGERGLISEVRTGMGRCVSPQGRSRLERRLWGPASPAILTGARETPCLPSAGRQPTVELAEPVMAPEGLAIDEEEG